METLDGGWTVIQKRVDGSVGFDRIWTDYKNGFGVPDQEVWIGNDVIHQLTKGNDSSLYVSITQVDGTTLFELYGRFSVSDEAENYQLFMDGPAIGTLGDRMLNVSSGDTLSGMFFTTPDRDNDRNPVGSCAVRNRGGWWFNYCHDAYFNGPWGSTIWSQPWFPLIVDGRDVRGTLMMVKRV
ncbi:fibroleukin-like [Saccostrea echinata]|uniref:fibroleukin-like n=1 Tax=Saccostrea echinata TaxID=191078 RepID=UPI002A7F9C28|nr:fibroleukin-like [Saccostrea echinata]